MNQRIASQSGKQKSPKDKTHGVRVPPHATHAEEVVLGSLMLLPTVIGLVDLAAEDFYSERHQIIYKAIKRQESVGLPYDALSVSNALSESEKERTGGLAYIVALADRIPSAAGVGDFVRIVREKSKKRRLIELGHRLIDAAYEDDEVESSEEIMDMNERVIQEIRHDDHDGGMRYLHTYTEEFFQGLSQVLSGGPPLGVRSGFVDLDKKVGSLRPGQLIILAARPSMGKTSLALDMLTGAVLQDIEQHPDTPMSKRPAIPIFSVEMKGNELYARIMSQHSKVSTRAFRGEAHISDEDLPRLFEEAKRLAEYPIVIGDNSNLTVSKIRVNCMKAKAKHGSLGLVVVDYLQLLSSAEKAGNRTEEVGQISRDLKKLAQDMDVPVLALSQLNRALEKRPDKRPIMADLRESGGIEQDADVIMFVYRDEVYHEDTEDRGIAEVIIAKQRDGELGTVRLRFFPNHTKFHDLYPSERI